MSSTNKHNTTYSAADIEKYLKGELSPREMHDLENAALEDPFLADALEGMSADVTSLGTDLDELHTRLNARVTAPTGRNNIRRSIPRWSMAATIILLLGIGGVAYFTFFTGRSKLATDSSPVTAAPPGQAAPSSSAESTEPLKQAEPPAVATQPPTAESKAPPKQEEPPAVAAPPVSVAPKEPPLLARSKPPADKAKTDTDTEADTIAGAFATADVAPKSFAVPSNSLVFKGRVLDIHNNPVPGASLTLNGYANTGTVTDCQGQFKLYLPPQDSTQYVTVAMIGYGQKSLPLNTLTRDDVADHVIHLQPSETSLDEVVVSGFGSKRKEAMATAPSTSEEELDSLWQKARPVIGKNAYLHYLDTAQKSLALDSSITGTETVSFEVDKKGILTSFKIEQSLSPAHDEAIIRLVKEGPAWQLLKQKKVRATVSLHF